MVSGIPIFFISTKNGEHGSYICGDLIYGKMRMQDGSSIWTGGKYEIITEKSGKLAGSFWDYSCHGYYFQVDIFIWICSNGIYGANSGERQLYCGDPDLW